MTAPVLDAVESTVEDLDYQQACTSHHGCQQPAVWVVTFTCCTRMAFLCPDHLLRWVRAERAAINGHAVACHACGTTIDTFEEFARWERL